MFRLTSVLMINCDACLFPNNVFWEDNGIILYWVARTVEVWLSEFAISCLSCWSDSVSFQPACSSYMTTIKALCCFFFPVATWRAWVRELNSPRAQIILIKSENVDGLVRVEATSKAETGQSIPVWHRPLVARAQQPIARLRISWFIQDYKLSGTTGAARARQIKILS